MNVADHDRLVVRTNIYFGFCLIIALQEPKPLVLILYSIKPFLYSDSPSLRDDNFDLQIL